MANELAPIKFLNAAQESADVGVFTYVDTPPIEQYPLLSYEGNGLFTIDYPTGETVRMLSDSQSPIRMIILGRTNHNGEERNRRTYFLPGPIQKGVKPVCTSNNGEYPDGSSTQIQSYECATCLRNAKGSGANNAGKACKTQVYIAAVLLLEDKYLLVRFIVNATSAFATSEYENANYFSLSGLRVFLSRQTPPRRYVEVVTRVVPHPTAASNFRQVLFAPEAMTPTSTIQYLMHDPYIVEGYKAIVSSENWKPLPVPTGNNAVNNNVPPPPQPAAAPPAQYVPPVPPVAAPPVAAPPAQYVPPVPPVAAPPAQYVPPPQPAAAPPAQYVPPPQPAAAPPAQYVPPPPQPAPPAVVMPLSAASVAQPTPTPSEQAAAAALVIADPLAGVSWGSYTTQSDNTRQSF